MSELEFSRDSTELKQVWLCARCSFISFGANERTKENIHPSQALDRWSTSVVTRESQSKLCFPLATPSVPYMEEM